MSPDTQRLAMRHLGLSLITALLLILIGAGLFWLSQQHMSAARTAQRQAQAQAREQHERYMLTSRDEPLIRQAIESFKTLRQQGLIGPENRLEWAGAVREASEKYRLQPAEFSIEPQRSLSKLDAAGQFQLSASTMRLRLELLHEGELLRFVDELAQRPDAIVHARQCNLSRQPAPPAGEASLLKAECELDWITITPAPNLAPQP